MIHVWMLGRWAVVASCAVIGAGGFASVVVAQEVDARARIVTLAPSGGDDTVRLQAAFDHCAALGVGCTLRLEAGTFYVGHVVSRGFDGVLAGVGHDVTIIEPLRSARAAGADMLTGSSAVVNWPSTLTFVDATIMVAAVSVQIPIVHVHRGRPATSPAPASGSGHRRVGGGRCARTVSEVWFDDGRMLATACG